MYANIFSGCSGRRATRRRQSIICENDTFICPKMTQSELWLYTKLESRKDFLSIIHNKYFTLIIVNTVT